MILPAPNVTRQSAFCSRISVTISMISLHMVWDCMPLRTPTTCSLPRASINFCSASGWLRDIEPEVTM